MRISVLLIASVLIYNSASGQVLNSVEGVSEMPVSIYQQGKIVSEIFIKQESCPQLAKDQNSCYVLHEIELFKKTIALKTPVQWKNDQWGERFQLVYPNLEKVIEAPYFFKSADQSVIQFNDYGARVPNNYQVLISKQGENLVVEEIVLIDGGSHDFSYRFGNPDYTSITASSICRKRNLNHVVYEGEALDLGQLPLTFDLENDCVFCLASLNDLEPSHLKEKTLEYLNCQFRDDDRNKPIPLPKDECLMFCETIGENKWPPVE